MKPLLLSLVVLLGLFGNAAPALAAKGDDEGPRIEAYLEGYPGKFNVKLDEASTALTWITFIVLAGVGLSVLFKDAKRSHLD